MSDVYMFSCNPTLQERQSRLEESMRHMIDNLTNAKKEELNYDAHIRSERKKLFGVLTYTSGGLAELHAHTADCIRIFCEKFELPKAVIVHELLPRLMTILFQVEQGKLTCTEDAANAIRQLITHVLRRNSF